MKSDVILAAPLAPFVPSIVFDGVTYFSTDELGCRCTRCQGRGKLALGFRVALITLRLAYGKAMYPTSCARCDWHNSREGGAESSYHRYETDRGACAIDIAKTDSVERRHLVMLALQLGWRVQVRQTYVHLDRAPEWNAREESKLFI